MSVVGELFLCTILSIVLMLAILFANPKDRRNQEYDDYDVLGYESS